MKGEKRDGLYYRTRVRPRLSHLLRLSFSAYVVNKDARTKAVSTRPSNSARKARLSASSASTASGQAPRSVKAAVARARRTWFVLGGLVGGLAITGALLTVLAPPPLAPDATASLFAVGQDQSIDRIFDTPASVQPGRWHSIYVHQSLTPAGDALTLAQGAGGLPDHFLIGNGDPLPDGALQTGARWSQQTASGAIPGVEVPSDCLTICIVGDFNHTRPTPMQQTRLVELVGALQKQLGIAPDQVQLGVVVAETSVAGVGSRFPISAIRSQLPQ